MEGPAYYFEDMFLNYQIYFHKKMKVAVEGYWR
jgi:hypothetical protein